MKSGQWQFKIGLAGLLIALLGWATPASAGFVSDSNPVTLFYQFNAFVFDFGDWSAAHNNMPLFALEITPSDERTNMVLLLWWFWMHDVRSAHPAGAPLLSPQTPVPSGVLSSQFPFPAGPGGRSSADSSGKGSGLSIPTSPIGTILGGPNGDNSLGSPRGGGDGSPSGGGNGSNGDNSLGTPHDGGDGSLGIPHNGGDGSLGNGNDPGIGSFQPNPSSDNDTPNDGRSPDDDTGSGGASPSTGDSSSPDPASVPEPSAFILFCCGGLGLLTYGYFRWRTARCTACARA